MEKKVCLVVIDGWGLAPPSPGNAITNAHTPVMDTLSSTQPFAKLYASEVKKKKRKKKKVFKILFLFK
jgi:bisphosphoglycerate-independent phosphoglycerate mutase (AlkP superfamily)